MNLFETIFPTSQFSPAMLQVLCWLAFGKLILGLGWEFGMKLQVMRTHRVFRIDTPKGQRLREIKSSWHVFSDAIVLYALVRLDLIRLAPETLEIGLLSFALLYVWVETWYYFTHRLMHSNAFFYQLHRSHHLTKAVTPLSSISMSWVEKWIFYTCGWLGFMALMSHLMPVSLYGIASYYLFHFLISLHGHSNVESSRLGLMLSKVLYSGSATSHALHHARFRVNYGFSSMLLDRMLGTYAEDTSLLQERALAKTGVESFKWRSPSEAVEPVAWFQAMEGGACPQKKKLT